MNIRGDKNGVGLLTIRDVARAPGRKIGRVGISSVCVCLGGDEVEDTAAEFCGQSFATRVDID